MSPRSGERKRERERGREEERASSYGSAEALYTN